MLYVLKSKGADCVSETHCRITVVIQAVSLALNRRPRRLLRTDTRDHDSGGYRLTPICLCIDRITIVECDLY